MKVQPVEIHRIEKRALEVIWSDGLKHEIPSSALRIACPCATCREARGDQSHDAPLTTRKRSLKIVQNSLDQEISLERIWAIGNYAIGCEWADGHSTGIYPFDLLRALAARDN